MSDIRPGRVGSTWGLRAHWAELDAYLVAWEWLWRPQPFKELRPIWSHALPDLTRTLLDLDDAAFRRLAADHHQTMNLLAGYLPDLRTLGELTALPHLAPARAQDCGPRLRVGVPGRKRAQIEALATVLEPAGLPLLEWCGGKGHLGRLLAARWSACVSTLERSAELCAEGERLARRGRVEQRFLSMDALSPAAAGAVQGCHVVALHACGELHRSLLRSAVLSQVPALDLVPCCYHHLSPAPYCSLCGGASLQLTSDDLRLAVTDTATSGQRVLRDRDQDMAWKLGFDQLRRETNGGEVYQPTKPVPKAWLQLGFEGYCGALASRENVVLPLGVDWEGLEQQAWRRQAEVMRLSLVRHAFRRAVELWLVLDLACYLEAHGYQVGLGTFCSVSVTPRNILLSARL